MDRKTRIRDMVAWQSFYNELKQIVSTYEDDERKLEKLTQETQTLEKQKSDAEAQLASLNQKIESESAKLEHVYSEMDSMEKDRDNLKMARQIKSWEKDMEKYAQDKEVLEAQVYYDKAKQGDLTHALEEVGEKLQANSFEIVQLTEALDAAKAETLPERTKLEEQLQGVAAHFDTHFMEYFNRLLVKNQGSVLSPIENDACSVCNIHLPSSYLGGNDLHETEDTALMQCPNCFRYLYSDDILED
ncbi:MAG: zinc ribbon domain-containing protein [Brevinema sp.]